MKKTEKNISYLIKSQFPSFYQEEGPMFIRFVEAYYEWLEEFGLPGEDATNHVYQARSLTEYKDIDTTMDEFLVHFKEKYLKNIQFDTATNKPLLVKNSLDLYRSKGTERSIDLFFKLIFGTDAKVSYPAERLLKPSSGVWEVPYYIEISPNKYNVNYVGKQIIGDTSGAKAFVERYIKRKTKRGYVDVLYVSNVDGDFVKDEILGYNVNNVPSFDKEKNSKITGSLNKITVQSKAAGYKIGDIVDVYSGNRGVGGVGRVANTSSQSGVVNFTLEDGGFGYTLSANAIISEKVINLSNVESSGGVYFHLLSEVYQPIVQIEYSNSSVNIDRGAIFNYYSGGNVASSFQVISNDQSGSTGTIYASPIIGHINNNVNYSISGNTSSIKIDDIQDVTITAKVMGLPNTAIVSTSNEVGSFSIGDYVYQGKPTNKTFEGYVIASTSSSVTLANFNGTLKNTINALDSSYTIGAGTITTVNNSLTVNGNGTSFNQEMVGDILYATSGNVVIGIVNAVANTTRLTLEQRASISTTTAGYASAYQYLLMGNNSTARVESVGFDIGVYDIREGYRKLNFSEASSTDILNSDIIYQTNYNNDIVASGKIVTASISANSGYVTYVPTYGYFGSGSNIRTSGNTFVATVNSLEANASGGDFLNNSNTYILSSSTKGYISRISFGFGADFDVGSLTEIETIMVGADSLSANNVDSIDYNRYAFVVSNSSPFSVGDYVVQGTDKTSFNPISINANTGFIAMANANQYFEAGDPIRYTVDSGNTVVNGLLNEDFYQVVSSNSTGLIISYGYEGTKPINSNTVSTFADNVVSETGHYIYKMNSGVISDIAANTIWVNQTWGEFGASGVSNGNLSLFPDNIVNTAIVSVSSLPSVVVSNTEFMSVPLSGLYGFPKLATANVESTIFNCLSFDQVDIGVIATLAKVNPGSDYNVSPFVLVYDELTASGRDDYIINIQNKTKDYIKGEIVYQQSPTLTRYRLSVDGHISNSSFHEHNIDFNSKFDVDNNKILIPYTTVTFNPNTSISADFVSIGGFESGDLVRYYTESGNTVIDGLANNDFYFVVDANTSGFSLSSSEGGSAIALDDLGNENGHHLVKYKNNYRLNEMVVYEGGSDTIGGLTANTLYYVVNPDSHGISLSSVEGGSEITLTPSANSSINNIYNVPGFVLGDKVYQTITKTFNANTDVSADSIALTPQSFRDGTEVRYYTSSGNTALSGMANNSTWYVVGSNSTYIKLANTIGGTPITLTKGATESGHNFVAIANGTVYSTSNGTISVSEPENNFTTGYNIYSYTNPYAISNVTNVELLSVEASIRGIVKEDNANSIKVKRISYETSFSAGGTLVGQISGSESNIVSVIEDRDQYPIGLNAIVGTDASIADGQISEIQVTDSGFGYVNGETVTIGDDDSLATGLVVVGGLGTGRGAYKSKKGFLSADSHLHDGYYYQEYSYEVFTAIPVDRYADMFKRVMHTAGTKFYGSVLIEDMDSLPVSVESVGLSEKFDFDPVSDISGNKITTGIEGIHRQINPSNINSGYIPVPLNKFSVGDYVSYYTALGNTTITGLANNSNYYVVESGNTGIKLSATSNGVPISVTSGGNENGHYISQWINPIANNDVVIYNTTPGPSPDVSLDLTSTNPMISLNRGSPATVVTSNGSLVQVGINVPRFEYDRVTLKPLGLLVEPYSSNQLKGSENTANTSNWGSMTGLTATPVAGWNIGGVAHKYTNDGTGTSRQRTQTVTTINMAEYALSIVLENVDSESTRLSFYNVTGSSHILLVNYNWVTKTLTTINGTPIMSRVIPLGIGPNGGEMVRLEMSASAGFVTSARFILYPTGSEVNTHSMIVHYAQFENSTYPTSYIKTSETAIQGRNLDDITINNISWLDENKGTFVVEGDSKASLTYPTNIMSLDDGTTATYQRLIINNSIGGNIGLVFRDNSVNTGIINKPSFVSTQPFKIAYTWGANNMAMAINGGSVGANTYSATPSPVSRVVIGGPVNNLGGHIKSIKYWNNVTPNGKLKDMSGNGGSVVNGLVDGKSYYAANATPLSTSLANEPNGVVINITSTDSELSHSLTKVSEED